MERRRRRGGGGAVVLLALAAAAAAAAVAPAAGAAPGGGGAAHAIAAPPSVPARYCPDGGQLEAGLCYARCRPGWRGLGCSCFRGARSYSRGCGSRPRMCHARSYRRAALPPAPGGGDAFSLVLSADPQLYRVVNDFKDVPLAGRYNADLVRSINRAADLAAWPWQAGGGAVTPPRALVVLGDLTEYYREDEVDAFRALYDPAFPRAPGDALPGDGGGGGGLPGNASGGSEVVGLPTWLMHGNHDIEINVNDCARRYRGMGPNVCALNAADTMRAVLTPGCDDTTWAGFPRRNVTSFDAGSMAYAFDVDDWHFVVLQYSPRFVESSLSIASSLSWLAAELSAATAQQRRIVLLLHAHRELGLAADPTFARLLSASNVVAIFYGHVHIKPWGLTGNYPNTNVPMFNCGASWYHVYCYAEFGRDTLRVGAVVHNASAGSAAPAWAGSSVHALLRQQRAKPVLRQFTMNPPAAVSGGGRAARGRPARAAAALAAAALALLALQPAALLPRLRGRPPSRFCRRRCAPPSHAVGGAGAPHRQGTGRTQPATPRPHRPAGGATAASRMADDDGGGGLALNVAFETDAPAPKAHVDWRERKRQARERAEKKRQRFRARATGRAPGADGAPRPAGGGGGGGGSAPRQHGARPPAGARGAGAALPRAKVDSLHGYGAALSGQQPQQRPAPAPAAAARAGQPAAAKSSAARGASAAAAGGKRAADAAPALRPAKKRPAAVDPDGEQLGRGWRSPPAARPPARAAAAPTRDAPAPPRRRAAAAVAAAESLAPEEEVDVMALVALNLSHEAELQEEAARAAGGGRAARGQQEQVLPGVVEFGDAPDEPDAAQLARRAAKQQQQQQQHGGGKKPGKRQQEQQAQQQRAKQRPLAQHRVGEMAHAEPNVPAEQRQQMFGAAAAAGDGDGGWGGLGLAPALADHLVALNFQEPTQVQQAAIPVLLSGRDALVRSPTGSGKTLAYLAPIVQALAAREPRISRTDGTHALVLVPTRELAVQVSDVLTALVRRFCWLVPGMLIGGEHRGHEKARLRKGVSLLVATPGRLLDHLQNTTSFRTDRLAWLVLDEADRLLDLGFEAKLREIVAALGTRAADPDNTHAPAAAPPRCTVLTSATLHPGLAALAGLSMRDPVGVGFAARVVGGALQLDDAGDGAAGAAPPPRGVGEAAAAGGQAPGGGRFELPQQLQQQFVEVPAKMRLVVLIGVLLSRLRRSRAAKVVVFFSNCDSVDFHAALLQRGAAPGGDDAGGDDAPPPLLGGCPVLKLHGDMRQPERTSALVTFSKASSCVLCCTDVAARGLDFPGVTTIVQYDPAGDPAEYVHRVGRTARMGQRGEALLFLLPSEAPYAPLLADAGVALTRAAPGAMLGCLPPPPGGGAGGRRPGRGGPHGDEGLGGAAPEGVAAALALQRRLVHAVAADAELGALALAAFRSFVRAYATHPAALKHVFHVKSLHLGHLAAAFGLREAPAKIGARGAVAERKKRKAEGQRAAERKQKAAWHRTAKAAAAGGLNGGVCTAIEGLADEFFCKCPAGFMGADCTAVYQECQKGLVCYNGGQCTAGDQPGSETCACPAKWTGATCKVPVETCSNKTDSLACMNGGACMLDTESNEHYCKCPPNVRGRHCQFGVKECKDGMYCMNDGSCSNDGMSCVCPSGFFGLHCQNNKRDPNADRIATGKLPGWAIALIVIGAVLTVAGAATIGFLVHRERKGSPYFKQWQNDVGGVSHI
ncbi:RH17 [Scenedesmus sp. PABB004]|nr:RH17 [Scenedesmus sp. PABB004]